MFDPYHKWLGIAPKDQPPNHYRLLGVDLFESDPEVIDAAANRQMAYLQQRATGKHAALSQKLLNEVAAARVCLLNPEKKADYDAVLREESGVADATSSTPATADTPALQTARRTPSSQARKPVPVLIRERLTSPEPWHFAVAIGAFALLLFGCWAVFFSGDDSETFAENTSEQQVEEEAGSTGKDQSEAAEEETTKEASMTTGEETVSDDVARDQPSEQPDEEVVVYNVELHPGTATLSVRHDEATVSGGFRKREVRIEGPTEGRSYLLVASCEGYETKTKWLHPSTDDTRSVYLSLEKEEVEPAIYDVTVEPAWARLHVKDGRGEVTGSGQKRTITIRRPDLYSSVCVVASCNGYETIERWCSPVPRMESNLTISLSEKRSSAHEGAIERGNVALVGQVRTYRGEHDGPVECIDISPRGTWLASATKHSVCLWNLASGEKRWSKSNSARTGGIAFDRDGGSVLLFDNEGIRGFDAENGRLVSKENLELGNVYISRSCRYLLSYRNIDDHPSAFIYDIQEGRRLRSLTEYVSAAVFSPDDRSVLYGTNRVFVRDVRTSKRRSTPMRQGGPIHALDLSRDGEFVVTGSERCENPDTTVRVWNLKSGRLVSQFRGHSEWLHVAAFSPDGSRVLSGGGGNSRDRRGGYPDADTALRLWDAKNGSLIHRFDKLSAAARAVKFTPDGEYAVSIDYKESFIRLWKLP